jgi:hypothetical protein
LLLSGTSLAAFWHIPCCFLAHPLLLSGTSLAAPTKKEAKASFF